MEVARGNLWLQIGLGSVQVVQKDKLSQIAGVFNLHIKMVLVKGNLKKAPKLTSELWELLTCTR